MYARGVRVVPKFLMGKLPAGQIPKQALLFRWRTPEPDFVGDVNQTSHIIFFAYEPEDRLVAVSTPYQPVDEVCAG